MSYFDWTGNKSGKSIYQTKIPAIICILLPLFFLMILIFCSGCVMEGLRQLEGSDFEIEFIDEDEPLVEGKEDK